MREEVCGAVDHGYLVAGEVGQERRDVLQQLGRVVTREEDRVREPGLVEGPATLGGSDVLRGLGQGDFVASVILEGDAGVVEAELVLGDTVGAGVGEEEVVPAEEALLHGGDAGVEVAEVARGEGIVFAEDDGLIEGVPGRDLVAPAVEDEARVGSEVFNEVGGEEASV